MKFDCHTHWARCFQDRDGRDPRKWLELLERRGVTHAFVLPTAGLMHDGKAMLDNDDLAAVCALSGGRMIPFCTAQIAFGDEAAAEIERCLATLHFRGVKFHPWLQGLAPNWPEMDRVCALAEQFDVPLLFHDGTPPFSLPSQMAVLARRHPRCRIILGHMGLLEHWREAIAAMSYAENLWACVCGPHLAATREIVRRVDHGRLLWGSDHGFTLDDFYPYRLGLMDQLRLSDELLERVFVSNPKRVLGSKYI